MLTRPVGVMQINYPAIGPQTLSPVKADRWFNFCDRGTADAICKLMIDMNPGINVTVYENMEEAAEYVFNNPGNTIKIWGIHGTYSDGSSVIDEIAGWISDRQTHPSTVEDHSPTGGAPGGPNLKFRVAWGYAEAYWGA